MWGALVVKNREIFHPFSRFFSLYHIEQGRNSAVFTLFRVRAIFRRKEKSSWTRTFGTGLVTE